MTDTPRQKPPHTVINPKITAQVQNDMCKDKHWTVLALSMDIHEQTLCMSSY
jgi:hypothetical protein